MQGGNGTAMESVFKPCGGEWNGEMSSKVDGKSAEHLRL